MNILIPSENVPVIDECDICVIGGSCTGIFAAVRAARLGARVMIIEKQNRFGGVAVSGLVGMWHSLFDAHMKQQIIGGLTFEILERLSFKKAVTADFKKADSGKYGIPFNPEELCLELDKLILENRVIPYLDTRFTRPVMCETGEVDYIVVENRSGRGIIKAKVFIDASGDGILCMRAGFSMRIPEHPQPPTACLRIMNWRKTGDINLRELIENNRSKYPNLPCGYYWGMIVPNSDMYLLFGTRVLNAKLLNGKGLTAAEMESRRQADALMCMLRDTFPEVGLSLHGLPSCIGIRETMHIDSLYMLPGDEMITGKRYDDAIANGTYPIDIHDDSSDQIYFMGLNGVKTTYRNNTRHEERLIPEGTNYPGFYQIPLRSIIPRNSLNVITAGRMIDADRNAFGAVRVMVNLNQCGEAAGVAAFLALNSNSAVTEINAKKVRTCLAEGGSCVL